MNLYYQISAWGFPLFLTAFLVVLFDKGEGTSFYQAGFNDGFDAESEDHVEELSRVFTQRGEAIELAAKHSRRLDAIWALVNVPDGASELGIRIKEILK